MKLKTSREKRILKDIDILNQEVDDLRRRKIIKCLHCKKGTQLSKAVVIRDHHYISPRGCSEGDYWMDSKEFRFVCFKCGELSRAYIGSMEQIHWGKDEPTPEALKTSPKVQLYMFIRAHTRYIGEILDDYDYDCQTVDELRKKNEEREKG